MMQRVILTGGIACGKSAAAHCFSSLNVPVLDADDIAKSLTQIDAPCYTQILAHFGPDFFHADGTLDRQKLGHHIFQHPIDKKWLESCLHPPIMANLTQQIEHLEQTSAIAYCLISIPLFAEMACPPTWVDKVIVVLCPPLIQLQRLLRREPGLSLALAQAKINAQATTAQRLRLADYTLHNDGTFADLKAQVYHLHPYLLQTPTYSAPKE